MPPVHPLKVTEVTRKQRRLVGDMESRNDLFYDKEIFTQIVRAENAMSPYFFFSKVLGGQGGALDEMFEPVAQGIGAEFIKILEESDFQEHARILDISRVPNELYAGENFDVTLDRSIADGDESLMGRDEETMFRIESRRPGTNGTDFTLQYIGIPGTKISGAFLRVNDILHVGYGNSKGQGSMNSNTLIDDLTKRTTFFNMSNIIRYGYTETGQYLSDEVYQFNVTKAMDGSSTDPVRTDLPVKVMRRILRSVDNALMFNTPNFDPRTKKIANQSANGRYHERPYFAGMYWMLDQCPWKWRHSKYASLDEGVQKLDYILQFLYNKLGRKNTVYAMAEGAGLEWLRKTILQGGLKKYGVNLWQQVTGGDVLKIGFEADQYFTSHGRIIIYDIGRAMDKWGQFDKTSFGGVSYRKRSNHIYLIPGAVKGSNGVMKKPAHIYFKEGGGYSRAFAFGYMNGITGDKGFTGDQLLNMQDQFIKNSYSQDRYRLDSPVDGREMHVLMQLVPYMDVRNVARLELF